MVALSEIIAWNQGITGAFPNGLTAVFVGGTSGVGEYTLKAFVKAVNKPNIYIVGRSQEAADRILAECKDLQPKGSYEFFKADVSLLSGVDDGCRQIKKNVQVIDLLFLSQGSMAFDKVTGEGLPMAFMLATHSRMRFMLNLLPLLRKSDSLSRVVYVGAATCEGPVDVNNISGKGLPLLKLRDQTASVATILIEEAARRAPEVSFIHNVPGVVRSNIARDAEGFKMMVTLAISKLLTPLIETPPAECAARQLFQATSARYPARSAGKALGAPFEGEAAHSSDGSIGSGVYLVNPKCEGAPMKVVSLLTQLRTDGVADQVWASIKADYERITGSEAMV